MWVLFQVGRRRVGKAFVYYSAGIKSMNSYRIVKYSTTKLLPKSLVPFTRALPLHPSHFPKGNVPYTAFTKALSITHTMRYLSSYFRVQ